MMLPPRDEDGSARLAMRRGLATPPRFTVGWHDALFEHYRITDIAPIVERLPSGIELDRHAGDAYISVVSFRMVDMRYREWLRLPFAHTYAQINVRVYVRSRDKTGVFFLRNFVSNRLAARAGRMLYGMPYRYQKVQNTCASVEPHCAATLEDGTRHQVAGRRGRRLQAHEDDPTSLLFFLTERYPLFSTKRGRVYEAQMLHQPWELYELEPTVRTHAIVATLGLEGALKPLDSVQTSPGVNVWMWAPNPLGTMAPLVAMSGPERVSESVANLE